MSAPRPPIRPGFFQSLLGIGFLFIFFVVFTAMAWLYHPAHIHVFMEDNDPLAFSWASTWYTWVQALGGEWLDDKLPLPLALSILAKAAWFTVLIVVIRQTVARVFRIGKKS